MLGLVLRHGSAANAFQTLQAGYRYFFYGAEACVAYVDTGSAWVAAGAPIAPLAALAEVTSAFLNAARAEGKRACFFATESPLASTRTDANALRALAVGEQPIWDPRAWSTELARHRSLREQLRRARAKGVSTREVSAAELEHGPLREQMLRVVASWRSVRALAPMGFLVQVEPFSFSAQRRTFVAEQRGRVLGFAGLVPVPARGGWFLADLVRVPDAPNGTGELLVHTVMSWATENQCSWLTLGMAPLSGALPSWLSRVRDNSRWLYDFAGLRAYKAKFAPQAWQPLYLCYPKTQTELEAIVDTLRAFASGSLLWFGLQTLLRGPRIVLRALALLLVPWTLLLALAPGERWFGADWLKWAWVYFDVALALGLFRVLRKPSLGLLTVLALAVSADAFLTTVEALLWNARHARSALDYALLLLACAGPSLAALVLWGARRQRLHLV